MTVRISPPPINTEDKAVWNTWYLRVKDAINQLGLSFIWTNITFTGSNITDVVTRNHSDLQNIQGGTAGQYYHLTSTQSTAIASFNATQWTDLTDNGDTTIHYHSSDRDRINHTGTQTLATISDAGTAASQSGLTVVITTAPVTAGGVSGSMTFTNGVLTAQVQAT